MATFWSKTPENGDFNQYWYSPATISALLDEIRAVGGRVAFVSTPSLYFSLEPESRAGSAVFDYDRQWERDPGYCYYDFNAPEAIPEEHHHQFDLIVIDPPFITAEVWAKYATTAKLLAKEGESEGVPLGKYLCSTIVENAPMMADLLGVVPVAFQPSIPNLVYQYNMYANFPCVRLCEKNPEIPE